MDTPIIGHILVVDDNELNCDVLERRLLRSGHTVAVAGDGVEALAKLREQPFDLVLLDIMMPHMNGFQVLEAMKSNASLRHIPVIVISAADDLESVVRCIEIGAEDHLPKPFNPTILTARIDAALEKKFLRDQERGHLAALEREKRQVSDLLNIVIPIGVQLTHEPDFNVLLEKIVTGGKAVCHADAGALYLRTDADQLEPIVLLDDARPMSTNGSPHEPVKLFDADGQPNHDQVTAFVATTGEAVNIPNVGSETRFASLRAYRAGSETLALLALPLKNSRDQVIGVLEFANPKDAHSGAQTPFSPALQALLEALAALGAAALEAAVRESGLQRRLRELSIRTHIDAERRQEQVRQITESDYFHNIRSRIRELREGH